MSEESKNNDSEDSTIKEKELGKRTESNEMSSTEASPGVSEQNKVLLNSSLGLGLETRTSLDQLSNKKIFESVVNQNAAISNAFDKDLIGSNFKSLDPLGLGAIGTTAAIIAGATRFPLGIGALAAVIGSTVIPNYLPTMNKISDSMKANNVSKSINDSEAEIVKLKQKLIEQTEKQQDAIQTIESLLKEQKIYNIKTRINKRALSKLSVSSRFLKKFDDESTFQCVVISIDIRRSTELMLKAKTPVKYAKFISSLSENLSSVIKEHYGVFDKFTGDGILAFFPDFYSGKDAILRAWDAAQACHAVFASHYASNRGCFNVFLTDIGLGIGIDYGQVSLVNDARELTVVGIPVVYACRFSSAPAGMTYLNQPAMEQIAELHGVHAQFFETKLTIKNEGDAMAYILNLNRQAVPDPADPEWFEYSDDIAKIDENTIQEKVD